MPYGVLLTHDAVRDLDEIYTFIARHDAPEKAEYVLERIESAFSTLSESPDRGVYPKELIAWGIQDYREIFFRPYRIIYRIIESNVFILLIADGRRDMQTLLELRLFEA